MHHRHRRRRLAPALVALALCLVAPAIARAQEEAQPARPPAPRREEVNHEVQLYLLVAAGEGAARGPLPEALGGVVRQLRATLQPGNYRVALTAMSRVRDGSNVEFRGLGVPVAAAVSGLLAPTSFSYSFGSVRLVEDPGGARFVHFRPLRFTVRVTAVTGTTGGEGAPGRPVYNTEDTALTTEVSVREGEPTVIGTIATGRPDEIFVLVVSARRTGQR